MPMTPFPAIYRDELPNPELIEAVGIPVLTLMKANLLEDVDVPPSKKSCVVILSKIAPLACSNGDPPLATGSIPLMSVVRSTREEVSLPLASE